MVAKTEIQEVLALRHTRRFPDPSLPCNRQSVRRDSRQEFGCGGRVSTLGAETRKRLKAELFANVAVCVDGLAEQSGSITLRIYPELLPVREAALESLVLKKRYHVLRQGTGNA